MINRGNYDKIIADFGIENLDPVLKASHENYLQISEFYDDDDAVRETIELYFAKLEWFIKNFKSKEKDKNPGKQKKHTPEPDRETPKVKKETRAKPSAPKEKITKDKRSKAENIHSKGVEHLTEEVKIIRRFVGLHNKIKSKPSILSFIKALQKAIVQKFITKKSPFVKYITNIQEALIAFYNKMGMEGQYEIDSRDLSKLVAIAGGEKVYKSIGIIKRFIGLYGSEPGDRALNLLTHINNAVQKGGIQKDDPYFNKVKQIQTILNAHAKSNKKISISKAELNGLQGILNDCGCKQDIGRIYDTKGKSLRQCRKKTYSDAKKGACSHNKGLSGVMSAQEVARMQFTLLPFTDIWKDTFGTPEKNFTLMLHGEPGAGKSTALVKFAKYLSGLGRVLYVTPEEYKSVTMQNLVKRYMYPVPYNVTFSGNLSQVNPKDYDFVIFDSVNAMRLSIEEFVKMKKDCPNTAFIYVLQNTKDGQFRGGKEWEHEAQIAAEVSNGNLHVYKNRYGIKGNWYFFDQPDEYKMAA
jgi:hypothetical protein